MNLKKMIFMLSFTAFANFALIFYVSLYSGEEIHANGNLDRSSLGDSSMETELSEVDMDEYIAVSGIEAKSETADLDDDNTDTLAGNTYDDSVYTYFHEIIVGDFYTEDKSYFHFYNDGSYSGFYDADTPYITDGKYCLKEDNGDICVYIEYGNDSKNYILNDSGLFLELKDVEGDAVYELYRK